MTTGGSIPPSAEADATGPAASPSPPTSSPHESTSLLGSLQSRWREISDAQRISRLQQCQVLHDALTECRRRNRIPQRLPGTRRRDSAEVRESSAEATSIETVPAGIRMLHYFQWRNLDATKNDVEGDDGDGGSDDTKKEERSAILKDARQLCTREVHALWACRAVATACGPDLIRVKRCFDDHGPSILRHSAAYEVEPPTVSSPESAVRSSSASQNSTVPPCVDVQRALGSCVATGIHSLNQRREDKSK